jgi:hypothetical protein
MTSEAADPHLGDVVGNDHYKPINNHSEPYRLVSDTGDLFLRSGHTVKFPVQCG